MLIQIRAPRLRPPGGPVFRVRRDHPLAADLRACIIFGGAAGVGVDLVTGLPLAAVNAPVPAVGEDGPHLDAASAGHAVLDNDDTHNITGAVTIAVRAHVRVTNGALINKIPAAGSGGSDTPWCLATNANSIFSIRSNASYVLWQSNTAGLATGSIKSYAVSSADIHNAPTFYYSGVADGASVLFSGGGVGAPNTNTNGITVARTPNGDNQLDGYLAIAVVAARIWSADEHASFDADPYGLIEDAPLWHFLSAGEAATPHTATPGPGELTLQGLGGAVTAAAIIAAGAGTLALQGFSATVTAAAAVAGGAGAVALQGFAADVAAGVTVAGGAGALTWQGHSASIAAGVVAPGGAGTIALQGHQGRAREPLVPAPAERTLTWPYAARAATWIAEAREITWPDPDRTVTWRQ